MSNFTPYTNLTLPVINTDIMPATPWTVSLVDAVLGNHAPTRTMIGKETTNNIQIYVPSAARFKRASESATLSCNCFDPKCSHIQPHHTGEKAKSQPNETCVVELESAVQVR